MYLFDNEVQQVAKKRWKTNSQTKTLSLPCLHMQIEKQQPAHKGIKIFANSFDMKTLSKRAQLPALFPEMRLPFLAFSHLFNCAKI